MRRILAIVFSVMLVSCSTAMLDNEMEISSGVSDTKAVCNDPGVGVNGAAAYSTSFKAWMNANGYSDLAVIEGFGGSGTDCLTYTLQPIIYIHGNSDYAQSWSSVRTAMIGLGYKPVELYAIGWGGKGALNAASNHHKADYMISIRRFIAAVKGYTKAAKVDVISHSMGVTLARKAIKGGNAYNTYDRSGTAVALGASLKTSVDTFVGIAGGNRGLNSCGWWDGGTAVWSNTCWSNGLSMDNPFIDELTYGSTGQVASYIYSIYSYVDEIVCIGSCYVWYTHTSIISGQTGGKSYSTVPYGHFGVKNLTASVQKSMVVNHTY
jgi:hypothetical protein